MKYEIIHKGKPTGIIVRERRASMKRLRQFDPKAMPTDNIEFKEVTQTAVVSEKKLGMILDYIQRSNGVTIAEVAEGMKISKVSAHVGVKELLKRNCVSEGAVKYTKKRGGEGLRTGYFYENDL